jgi:hypothetical protein
VQNSRLSFARIIIFIRKYSVPKLATDAKRRNVGGNGAKTYPTENKKQKKRNYFENDNTALNIIF